jgi:hypothetical protein
MKIGQQCKMRDTAPVLYGADLATFIVHGRRRYLYHTENTTVKLVEAAGVELSGVLITRKLLIPGTATTAKKASLPDPLYVYCTKMLSLGSRTDTTQ